MNCGRVVPETEVESQSECLPTFSNKSSESSQSSLSGVEEARSRHQGDAEPKSSRRSKPRRVSKLVSAVGRKARSSKKWLMREKSKDEGKVNTGKDLKLGPAPKEPFWMSLDTTHATDMLEEFSIVKDPNPRKLQVPKIRLPRARSTRTTPENSETDYDAKADCLDDDDATCTSMIHDRRRPSESRISLHLPGSPNFKPSTPSSSVFSETFVDTPTSSERRPQTQSYSPRPSYPSYPARRAQTPSYVATPTRLSYPGPRAQTSSVIVTPTRPSYPAHRPLTPSYVATPVTPVYVTSPSPQSARGVPMMARLVDVSELQQRPTLRVPASELRAVSPSRRSYVVRY